MNTVQNLAGDSCPRYRLSDSSTSWTMPSPVARSNSDSPGPRRRLRATCRAWPTEHTLVGQDTWPCRKPVNEASDWRHRRRSACAVAPRQAQLNTQHIKGTGSRRKSGSTGALPERLRSSRRLSSLSLTRPMSVSDAATEIACRIDRGPHEPCLRRRRQRRYEEEADRAASTACQVLFPVGANNRNTGTEIDANRRSRAPDRLR